METLIVGIVGILATLISSSLGLFFTAKARAAPQRDILFERQFDLLGEFAEEIGKARICSTVAFSDLTEFRNRACDDLRDAVAALSRISDAATLILPVDLWKEVKALANLWSGLLDAGNRKDSLIADRRFELDARAAKTFVMARTLLGIEELSTETMGLFTRKDDLTHLGKLDHQDLLVRYGRASAVPQSTEEGGEL